MTQHYGPGDLGGMPSTWYDKTGLGRARKYVDMLMTLANLDKPVPQETLRVMLEEIQRELDRANNGD